MRFYNTEALLLLWLIPLLIPLYLYASYRRKIALERFSQIKLLASVNTSISYAKRRLKFVLFLCAIAFLVLALSRPAWNPLPKEMERRGRDVLFILDVSKSMLAEDLVPNRLERSKFAITDCIDRLEGDRVGLVVFAGAASLRCPLTLDYGFFKMMLEDVDVDSVGRGGTMIGDAIRKGLRDVFEDDTEKYKDIILITDGEDHDSFPVEAASEAGQRGVRIIAIGLGDEDQGRRIPITDSSGNKTFLQYEGREVWSKLDADTLRKMANASVGGKYLNVATGNIDLGDVYEKLVMTAEKKDLSSRSVKRYEDKFQIFLALALILLCVEICLGERRKGDA